MKIVKQELHLNLSAEIVNDQLLIVLLRKHHYCQDMKHENFIKHLFYVCKTRVKTELLATSGNASDCIGRNASFRFTL